jgi:RNA polymerase sigma-70 factor, ECF subfamily
MERAAVCGEMVDGQTRTISPDALAATYLRRVLRFASMVSPPGVDPEDVAQEAMITALSRLEKFDARRGSIEAWLWRIVLSRAQDAGRAASRRELLFERLRVFERTTFADGASPETLAINELEDRRLLAAVRRLPRRYRTVIAMRYGAGLTGPEIAEMLGVSRMTVVKTTQRALGRLRKDLEGRSG